MADEDAAVGTAWLYMGDCGASGVEMISLGIGQAPVWKVCAQVSAGPHPGTSVAATEAEDR